MGSGLISDSETRPPWQRRARTAVVGIVVLVGIVVAFALWRGSAGSSVGLVSTYDMTFDNLTFDIQTGGALTEITEDASGSVTGQMTVGPGLFGTGPITGTFANGTFDFTGVTNGIYTGTMDGDGKLTGTYTYGGQEGEWTATPTEKPASSGGGLPWWLWVVAAGVLVVAIGYVVVRRRRGAAIDAERAA